MKVNQKWILESAEPVAPEKQTTVREAGGSLQESHGGREWDVVLIVEGPGASGDYSREVLERDVPGAFPVGTHIYVDHPTESEMWDRPERSVRDLAGTLVKEAYWSDDVGGMRSRVRIMDQWTPLIEQMGSDIGLSIRAQAIVSPEANEAGRYDIMSIVPWPTNSVDIVTHPGAGGRFQEAVESIRATITSKYDMKEASVDLKDIQKVVTEAIAPLIEAHKEPEAPTAPERKDSVKQIVESDLPASLKVRVAEALDANPDADVEGLIKNMTDIAEAVRAEAREVKEADDVRKHGREPVDLSIEDLKF